MQQPKSTQTLPIQTLETLSLQMLFEQETDLQFSHFNHDTAWHLGTWLQQRSQSSQLAVAIEIYAFGQILFSCALPGSSPNNFDWIRRKRNSVLHFGHSSFYLGQSQRDKQQIFEDQPHIDAREFCGHGGSFPIRLQASGLVGAVTVSGLPQAEDHALVVEAVRHLIDMEGK
ncbi:MAG: heme-degrading domain-containing protein [Motiliproteus sp.]